MLNGQQKRATCSETLLLSVHVFKSNVGDVRYAPWQSLCFFPSGGSRGGARGARLPLIFRPK